MGFVMAYADGDTGDDTTPMPRARCGMARAADLIGDRWTLLIIREALYGVTRFDAMQADLGIPRTVLSGRLKKLCEIGVFQTRPYKKDGQRARHQYVLTAMGVELALPMIALMQWGEKHFNDDGAVAEIVERRSGAPCHVGLVTEAGAPIAIGAAQLRLKS
jgi:DNA-binding HxlR family transcriptional regulator